MVPRKGKMGTRRRLNGQIRGCPRNCKRRADGQIHWGYTWEGSRTHRPASQETSHQRLPAKAAGWVAKGDHMFKSKAKAVAVESAVIVGPSLATRAKAAAAIVFMMGAGIVFMVGFAHSDVMHNAAHDTRHTLAFPCH